ncbi:hypothetical protein BGZ95_001905 [Linnemannia exigua]|uniref:F-box domain-containing protein n=1 Tax=Linnemannia exigua TaxID=604196 RepID=A0AAD4D673_9FUNG|nr:hypothetical protein BGZ95_001905 [Linnemannia exigua]
MSLPPMEGNLPLSATTTATTTNAHKKTLTTLLNLPPEILSQIASHVFVATSSPDYPSPYSCQNLLPYLVIHSVLTPYFLQHIWRNISIYDFKKFKASAIDTGALQRNGRFIRSFKGIRIDRLSHLGVGTCPALEEIRIYGDQGEQVEDSIPALAAFFGQHQEQHQEQEQEQEQEQKRSHGNKSSLRKLHLSDGVLRGLSDDNEEDVMRHFQDVLRLIPASVEELSLDWMGFYEPSNGWMPRMQHDALADAAISTFQTQDLARRREGLVADQVTSSTPTSTTAQQAQTNDTASTALWLPGIKSLILSETTAHLSSLAPLFKTCPNLESLSFFGCIVDKASELTLLLRTHCPKLSSLNMSRYCGNRFGFPDPTDLPVLLYASVSGWKSLAFSYTDRFSINPAFQRGLLHHAGNIETIFFEGMIWKNRDIHAFLCEAPRLRRFLAIDSPVLTPQDVLVGDWACTELEIFRMAIDMIPRPDLPPLPPPPPPLPMVPSLHQPQPMLQGQPQPLFGSAQQLAAAQPFSMAQQFFIGQQLAAGQLVGLPPLPLPLPMLQVQEQGQLQPPFVLAPPFGMAQPLVMGTPFGFPLQPQPQPQFLPQPLPQFLPQHLPQLLPQPLPVTQPPFQFQPQPLPQPQPQPLLDQDPLPAPTPENVVEVVTPEESHRLQRQVYRQLGRLTKLQELVLGEFELDELTDALDREEYQDDYKRFVPSRRRCLEMTLESGMDLLGELNLLRRVGLNRLEVPGFLAKEEDRRWVKEKWPLLETGYRNDFWKVLKRWTW